MTTAASPERTNSSSSADMDFRIASTKSNLSFEDITCRVRGANGEQKLILNGVSGCFRSGRLTAIIGPSGSGKTTLMNVLSGFRTKGVVGRVKLGGKDRVLRDFRRYSCYIEQEVAMMDHLTVHETMTVATRLKVPSSVPNKTKEAKVERIVELLGLQDCLNTLVGKLSGGEKKRLSIAVELVTNPPIMFFDEPTSNLDSMASRVVLDHLRWLADGGRIVICVVHQPSSKLFSKFDDLLALSGGEALYHGPLSDLVATLGNHGFRCPEFYNPSDFVIEVACGEHGSNLEELVSSTRARTEAKIRGEIKGNCGVEDEVDGLEVKEPLLDHTKCNGEQKDSTKVAITLHHGFSTLENCCKTDLINGTNDSQVSMATQMSVLLWRSSICTYRNLYLTQLTLLGHLLVGLLLGFIFYDIGGDANKATSNVGCIFFFLLFLFFANAMPTVQTYPIEMPVVVRQFRNGWFSLNAYFLAKTIADVPMQLIAPTLFLGAAYYLTGQPPEFWRGTFLWAICVSYTAVAQGIGLVFGAAFDVDFAVFLVPLVTIPMLLFSGFFVHLDALPTFINGLSYISHSRFAYEGSMQVIYGFNRTTLHCSVPYCYYRLPEKLLQDMHLNELSYWTDLTALFVYLIIIKMALYFVLYRKVTPRQ